MTKTKQTLWDAIETGTYPAGTTAHDLANVKNEHGWSGLHEAASYGHCPPGTTAQKLAGTKNKNNYSALHTAALHAHLPRNTTTALLKRTKDNKGTSAWDSFCICLQNHPTYALELPPQIFKEDCSLATTTIQTAIKNDPSLQSQATIWLGNVLAEAQTHRGRTTPLR